MSETIITVQGKFSAFYPAERATVSVSVHREAAKREPAFAGALAASTTVRESIVALHDPAAGPVTWWASDSIQVWTEKPWNNEGKQLPLVYHARIGFTVKFSDFEALARWIEAVSATDSVSVGSIAWALTDARRTGVTAEVRSRAVKDAVAKASVYAQSIGLGTVTAVAIADPGMLGDQVHGQSLTDAGSMRAMKASGGSEPELSLKPEDIEVSAVVDARFVAR
ncbi:uncharacterized protein YggE [Conyzicola lurida]|uniref:Uncharacterized protein YggE n=1 Tax=Conyzicola lurida TaxID=1172621 RepID=A0A841AH63_9MICO|nr:SIMPL domain-containing protein [Conyzicola lurida]MBB5842557.1 uncharacterized protein YggE [Conyzicola lurida]